MSDRLRPTEQLEAEKEKYKNAISEAFEAKGLPGMSILLIEKVGGVAVFRADVDDGDGLIDTPDELETAIHSIFRGREVIIDAVYLTRDHQVIDFVPVNNTNGTEYLVPISPVTSIIPELRFNLNNNFILYEMQHHSNDEPTDSFYEETLPLEPKHIAGLIKLISALSQRPNSFVSIHNKEAAADMLEPNNPHTQT